MEFLKVQLARLQEQFAGLTASQKMLSAALVAIMVMTLVWWGKYAGAPEMESLLEQDFTAEQIAGISAELSAHDIKYQVNGTRILVLADRKYEALAYLSFDSLLPHDTQAGLDDLASHSGSLWESQAQQEDTRIKAKSALLGAIISKFPRVQRAIVVADDKVKRGFDDDSIFPSASINIMMKDGAKGDTKLVNAAADFVAGSIAGMRRGHVHVVIDGAPWPVHDSDDEASMSGDEWMERVKQSESYYANKIKQQLYFIDGLAVSVSVQPETTIKSGETVSYDEKKSLQKELSVDSNTEETTTTVHGSGGGDPGATSNVGVDAGHSTTEGGGQTHEENKSTFENFPGRTREEYKQAAGAATVVSASVRVPRSYFVRIWRSAHPDMTHDPDEGILQGIIDAELPKIRDDVKGCTNLKDSDAVVVGTYADLPQVEAAPQAAVSSLGLMLGTHVKEIALGALAIVSLFMASMMVKKGAPLPAVAAAAASAAAAAATAAANERKAGLPRLAGGDEATAEVGEGARALDGIELDADAVREQQVLEQVTSMVKGDPDAAASLVKRWLATNR